MKLCLLTTVLSIAHTVNPKKNDDEKCPCMLKPESNECLKYDSRVQARTVDEAIKFFEDLSLQSEQKPPEMELDLEEHECKTKHCKVCRKMLTSRLQSVGLFENIYQADGYENFIDPYEPANSSRVQCDKYGFSRKTKKWKKKTSPRFKRSLPAAENSTDFIGTRYTLSCIPKGTPENAADKKMSLCTQCWAWRQLPDNYFPQYINELVCHQDSECLSGFANCNEGTRAMEVLRNDSSGMVVVTLAASSFCECQVQAGTAIQRLVTGDAATASETLAELLSMRKTRTT